jgi:hypothetical protein
MSKPEIASVDTETGLLPNSPSKSLGPKRRPSPPEGCRGGRSTRPTRHGINPIRAAHGFTADQPVPSRLNQCAFAWGDSEPVLARRRMCPRTEAEEERRETGTGGCPHAVRRRDLPAATGWRFVKITSRRVATRCDKVAANYYRRDWCAAAASIKPPIGCEQPSSLVAPMLPQSISRMN